MADQGGSQHGIARTSRIRTEHQKRQDLERITKYRELDAQVRTQLSRKDYSPGTFQLTSKLLQLNPEYYTIWNARRRLLIYGLFSKSSVGSWPSTALPTSSRTATTTTSSDASSSSLSTATRPAPDSQTAGKSGTTADEGSGATAEVVQDEAGDGVQAGHENDLSLIRSELGFTIPLLLAAPKCYWIWSYRLWILQQAIQRLAVPIARRIWEEELGLASKMLSKDRRNFHAWGYRRHVVDQLESPELGGSSMVEAEFQYTTKMISADLSNFSAWHNRSKLIPRLLDERNADDTARDTFLNAEFGQINEALNVGPEDQSLWYYHRFLMLNLVSPVGHPTITPALAREERITYVEREIAQIKELLDDYTDIKLVYEALIDYTMFLCTFLGREPDGSEKTELVEWLAQLKKLDPMRSGRWADLEKECGLVQERPHTIVMAQ